MSPRGVCPHRARQAARGRRVAAAAVTLALALAAVQTRAAAPPPKEIAEGNRLYHAGKYDDATQRYGELLVDDPDSPVVRFNMAAAQYKAGKFADAIATLQKADAGDDAALAARAAYNLGNAFFRLGEQAAAGEPQTALASYEQSLTAYKRAMGADPTYADPKFNHEFVAAQLEALKKKLAEQEKQQEDDEAHQEPQEQQHSEEQPPQPNGAQQDAEQSSQEQQPEGPDAPQQEAQSPAQPPESPSDGPPAPGEERGTASSQEPDAHPLPEDHPQAGDTAAAEASPEEPEQADRRQAQAIIDLGREEELRPDEVQRHTGTALVGEPREDW